jgi:UDP-hydrolysing UDP-N-acetyl-D-glucosamine 2-epimerase
MASAENTPVAVNSDTNTSFRDPGEPADSPPWLGTIGCVTTSRADAGIYRPLLRGLAATCTWQTICFAGGTHYAPRFGRTVDEFTELHDGRLIEVDHLVEGDGPTEVAATAGRAISAFSQAYAQSKVDLLFVLGDRTEMLAAALAATIHNLPIAHLHGGDLTEGAYDDACRHAITKLAHVHFPALPRHADRILAMGEEGWRCHAVGALALDSLHRFQPEPIDELSTAIGLDFAEPIIVVVFHPETLSDLSPTRQADELVAALQTLDGRMLVIGPNADVGHGSIGQALSRLVTSRPGSVLVPALSQQRYWSCLTHARLLVGNSSSGIMEAASFGLPVVNVGARQTGRLKPANVIDAPSSRTQIAAAVRQAGDPGFRQGLANMVNPYGDGRAAERIVVLLQKLPERRTLLAKRWPDPARP